MDFNGYGASGADPSLVSGVTVIGHWWYRDGGVTNNALFSEAIRFPVCP